MKTRTSILGISSIAVVLSIGIAIVDREWTMDSFWPLIVAGLVVLAIVVVGVVKKRRGK